MIRSNINLHTGGSNQSYLSDDVDLPCKMRWISMSVGARARSITSVNDMRRKAEMTSFFNDCGVLSFRCAQRATLSHSQSNIHVTSGSTP